MFKNKCFETFDDPSLKVKGQASRSKVKPQGQRSSLKVKGQAPQFSWVKL